MGGLVRAVSSRCFFSRSVLRVWICWLQALVSGQVDAAGMSAFAAKSVAERNPDKKLENKFTVTTAYYAAAVRPGDFELLQWVNTWVFINTQNGVLADIYKKYTGVDLPSLPQL